MIAPPTVIINQAYLAYEGSILFNNLNMTLKSGKWTCLLGPSGVGKTTLLRMIAGLVSPNTQFTGKIDSDNTLPLSQQISYMAQTDLLMPWLNTLDNTLFHSRLLHQTTAAEIEQAKKLLIQVGLKDALHKFPHQLSGGMRQRVALVRTLLQEKPIVLMDEPFSSVDAITRLQLQNLAAELLKSRTVLLVTHDPMEALRLGDEIYILSGQPATLSLQIKLNTPAPRDPASPELIAHQAELFHALLQAKQVTL